jgi:uncharacterized membrane protein YeaQ/YmgE (transglycosylase-associated protein family)
METIMGLVVIAAIGALVGWIASMIMGTDAQMGSVANIVVGIVGAILGSYLGRAIGFVPATLLGGAITGIIGAVILIGLLKVLGVFK